MVPKLKAHIVKLPCFGKREPKDTCKYEKCIREVFIDSTHGQQNTRAGRARDGAGNFLSRGVQGCCVAAREVTASYTSRGGLEDVPLATIQGGALARLQHKWRRE